MPPLDLTVLPSPVIEVALLPPPVLEVQVLPPPLVVVEFAVGQGPAGPPGATGGAYTHTQAVAATPWIVNHNLGFRPAVSVLSVGGVAMLAEVIHASANQALVYFDAVKAGLAVCS